jgi:hypothetical protein
MKAKTQREEAAPDVVPFTWTIKDWPPGVFPFKPGPARHLLRVHEKKLLLAGALSRPHGHRLVVFGAQYVKWLHSGASRVRDNYEVAANRPEHAHKRGFERARE